MSDFVFSPIKKVEFNIKNEEGALIKAYSLNAGSESFFRAIIDQSVQIRNAAESVMKGKTSYDELKGLLKDYINFALGSSDEFDFLFSKFDQNIFAMVELSAAVSKLGQDALNEKMKANAAKYAPTV